MHILYRTHLFYFHKKQLHIILLIVIITSELHQIYINKFKYKSIILYGSLFIFLGNLISIVYLIENSLFLGWLRYCNIILVYGFFGFGLLFIECK
jgi:hypothetical protein